MPTKTAYVFGGLLGSVVYCKVFYGAGLNHFHPDLTGKVAVVTGGNSGKLALIITPSLNIPILSNYFQGSAPKRPKSSTDSTPML